MRYEYLPHTADTKFRAYGPTLEEAFSNAAIALFNVMVETKTVKETQTHPVNAEGADLPGLLYGFLEQLIILLDAENFFLTSVKSIRIEQNKGTEQGYTLAAEVAGDDAARYETIGPVVKAVTYNDMQVVEEKKGKWIVQVVLDI